MIGDEFPEVLAAARAGGEWAWAELYGETSPIVLSYLRARGVSEPDDVLGEVFLGAVAGIDAFEGDEKAFRTWLLTLAHRRMVDHFRAHERRPVEPASHEVLVAAGIRGDVEAEALNRAEAARAVEAIRSLAPAQQEVLLLRLVADLTVEQVAEVLGKRVTAVKALQRRGLAALARKTSREGVSR